jgi:catechol 2,3-dioxygenase-like lactoylglutathione lyase family enzyme
VNVRRLDHFNCLATDVKANREFFEHYLGFRLTEQIVLNDGTEAGMWLTCTNKSYDFAYTREAHGVKGRFHHITYALDSREDILRAADVFLENGVHIETGPHKHAVSRPSSFTSTSPGEPGRGGECRRTSGACSGLEADRLDRGGTQEGSGLGPEDHQELPHAWYAAAARSRRE